MNFKFNIGDKVMYMDGEYIIKDREVVDAAHSNINYYTITNGITNGEVSESSLELYNEEFFGLLKTIYHYSYVYVKGFKCIKNRFDSEKVGLSEIFKYCTEKSNVVIEDNCNFNIYTDDEYLIKLCMDAKNQINKLNLKNYTITINNK